MASIVEYDKNKLNNDILIIADDLNVLQDDINKTDMEKIKHDKNELANDLTILADDLNILKKDVNKTQIHPSHSLSDIDRLHISQQQLSNDVKQMKRNIGKEGDKLIKLVHPPPESIKENLLPFCMYIENKIKEKVRENIGCSSIVIKMGTEFHFKYLKKELKSWRELSKWIKKTSRLIGYYKYNNIYNEKARLKFEAHMAEILNAMKHAWISRNPTFKIFDERRDYDTRYRYGCFRGNPIPYKHYYLGIKW